LICSQYKIPDKELVILAPPVYQQLLERMPQHLQNTTFAGDQVGAALRLRAPATAAGLTQAEQRRSAQQRKQEAHERAQARDSLLEMELLRVVGEVSSSAGSSTSCDDGHL
jgi:hypothetical protein